MLGGIHWRAALVGYSAGSTGEVLWDTQRDARRDSLAGCSGGLLGGIHWRAALVGYSARYTRRDPLASCSGGISTGQVWAWCRSIANADSNIKSNNPFLSGGKNTNFGSTSPWLLASHYLALINSILNPSLRTLDLFNLWAVIKITMLGTINPQLCMRAT